MYLITTTTATPTPIYPVNVCDNPAVYNYTSQGAQEYEDLIDQGVTAGHLTQSGPYYFRETDKKHALQNLSDKLFNKKD